MSEREAGRHLWAALHMHLRAQDVTFWWPARWERLPEWLQQELEVVATHWAAEQGDLERAP